MTLKIDGLTDYPDAFAKYPVKNILDFTIRSTIESLVQVLLGQKKTLMQPELKIAAHNLITRT